MVDTSYPDSTICLKVQPSDLALFYPLLQTGVVVRCRVGISLADFLTETLELPGSYVESRISTIFLNGSPVDDIESALISDGAAVALSSAMPGLVGATMRRKGFYSALRGTITHVSGDREIVTGTGSVRLKLFNLVMTDIGPAVLKRGFLLETAELGEFLSDLREDFFMRVPAARLNDSSVEPRALKKLCIAITTRLTELTLCT